MKINVKKKVMLAILAGGMLCANGAFAAAWYGSNSDPTMWTSEYAQRRSTGANLSLDGTAGHGITALNDYDYFYAGHGSSDVSGNNLSITAGSYSSNYFYAGSSTGSSSSASNNHITVTGGNFHGGYIYGGYSSGIANENIVEIKGGEFTNARFSAGKGQSFFDPCYDNQLTITGGTFHDGNYFYGADGGYGNYGNTLNLKIKMGGTASQVMYFEKMNFTLPSDIADGNIMLHTNYVAYNNALIGVDAADGVTLKKDDEIYLIKGDDGYGSISNDGATVLGGAGQISLVGTDLILTMLQDYGGAVPTSGGSEDQQKAPVEGIAAGVAMVNQSADLASGEGMTSLLANTVGGADTFGAMNAGSSKYKTGSHVDMDGWGVLIGAGTTKNWTSGDKTTYGLFFEYGKGDFDTYNNDIHGEGDSNNKGVGIMARHTLKNNTYFDANVRYGKQETEWSESEIGGYDTDSRYYGAAVGLGHVYPLENDDELDVYVRYSYGHVGACDAKVKDSDYHFDRVLSQRLRFGAKYNFVQKDNKAKPYVGMAWERELKGESRATITGAGEAPAPSLKGNTGIFEIGCDWDAGKWALGAGANAYIGKRKGWSGMARAFYNF